MRQADGQCDQIWPSFATLGHFLGFTYLVFGKMLNLTWKKKCCKWWDVQISNKWSIDWSHCCWCYLSPSTIKKHVIGWHIIRWLDKKLTLVSTRERHRLLKGERERERISYAEEGLIVSRNHGNDFTFTTIEIRWQIISSIICLMSDALNLERTNAMN